MKDFRSLEHKIRDVMIAEQEARNTAIRRKMSNVGRPDDNVKDETSKLAKQGEIKTKIIDEAAPDQQTDGAFMKDKDKGDKATKKKPDAQDEDDPREVKGGKTEVDLKPTTDDSTEDSTREDETSKNARKKVNKEIGAKGVKEHTMTGLNFGLPQSLIDTVRQVVEAKKIDEKLVGNQHKIDANKNNKIDAHDFKLLKSKKKMEEETEELDEVSKKTMASYITKASASTTDKSLPDNKVRNRYAGVALADKKMEKMRKEEVEELDEVSLKTKINAYKAAADHDAGYNYGDKVHAQADRLHNRIVAKHGRAAGDHANAAAYGKAPHGDRRDNPQKSDPLTKATSSTNKMRITKSGVAHKQDQKANASIIKSRLGKHGKSNVPEEFEFSEAELARLEEIAKGL